MSATGILPNSLTSARITELTSNRRVRGGHENTIRRFVASGEVAWVVNDVPMYKGKNEVQLKGAVKSALDSAAKKLTLSGVELPELMVIFDEEEPHGDTAGTLYLINMTLHAEQAVEDEDEV